jgi:hypothetical protein
MPTMTTGDLARFVDSLTVNDIETLEWLLVDKKERNQRAAQRALQSSFVTARA